MNGHHLTARSREALVEGEERSADAEKSSSPVTTGKMDTLDWLLRRRTQPDEVIDMESAVEMELATVAFGPGVRVLWRG